MRLVSWNIRGGLGQDNRRDLTRIAEFLLQLQPDAICLQEVHARLWMSGFSDQTAFLARHTRFHPAFSGGKRGNLILTAAKPTETRRLKLSPGRSAVAALVDGFWIVNTHWALRDETRLADARRLADWMNRMNAPKLMVADLNEAVTAPAAQELQQRAHLRDPNPTSGPTYPTDAPRHRIDVVLASEGVQVTDYQTLQSRYSDHLPVLVQCFT